MLGSVSCHGAVGNVCSFTLFKQAGPWGEQQNHKWTKYISGIVSQIFSSFDFSR